MLVLHFKYYKHHLVAIMIIFVGLIIDSIVNTKYKEDVNVYLYIVLMFLCSLFEALQDVLEKYLMEKMYVDPLLMLGGEGIVGVIVVGCSFFLVNNVECSFKSGLCYYGNSKVDDLYQGLHFLFTHYKHLIAKAISFVFLVSYNVFRVLMNFHYTPAHRMIPKTFRRFLMWLINFIPIFYTTKKTTTLIIGELASYIIQMFGVMMFVELIIVGVWGINKNIESEITKREKEEYDTRIDGLIQLTKREDSIVHNNFY